MRVGFDLDGVLCNLYDLWLAIIAYEHGIKNIIGQKDVTEYYIENVINDRMGTKLERRDIWDTLGFVINQTNVVNPYPDAKSALASVDMIAKNPVIITARLPKFKDATREWVDKWLGPYEVIHTGAPKKVDAARELGLDAFVEDKAETALAMAQAGIKSFIINRPWNQGVNGDSGVVRIEKLREVISHLNK